MTRFRVRFVLRYTRVSCQPLRATVPFDRVVLARDGEDALRQACLCLDRDLEELLSAVNAMNLSAVHVEHESIEPAPPDLASEPWNADPYPEDVEVPPHVVVSRRGA